MSSVPHPSPSKSSVKRERHHPYRRAGSLSHRLNSGSASELEIQTITLAGSLTIPVLVQSPYLPQSFLSTTLLDHPSNYSPPPKLQQISDVTARKFAIRVQNEMGQYRSACIRVAQHNRQVCTRIVHEERRRCKILYSENEKLRNEVATLQNQLRNQGVVTSHSRVPRASASPFLFEPLISPQQLPSLEEALNGTGGTNFMTTKHCSVPPEDYSEDELRYPPSPSST
ncbi:hypothetical protein DL96DRAFT_1704764 [Flagelloscypha sp. PMI_526]|nr:hypothetical protein DL96DRAFT_1704764 [Flagelloscypha sp. PMI_526]